MMRNDILDVLAKKIHDLAADSNEVDTSSDSE